MLSFRLPHRRHINFSPPRNHASHFEKNKTAFQTGAADGHILSDEKEPGLSEHRDKSSVDEKHESMEVEKV